jgi:hypothetical protein
LHQARDAFAMTLNTLNRDNHEYLLVRVGGGASAHLVAAWANEALYLAGMGGRPPRTFRPQSAMPDDDDRTPGAVDLDTAMLRAALWWP